MSDERTISGQCPRCGKPLPADAPEGLCAACLLEAGAETITRGSFSDHPTISSPHGVPVSRDSDGEQLSPGETWGPYRIGRMLGKGGMGEVYEAEHRETGRRIALKVLRQKLQNAEDRARFLREGQLAASVSHPHTVYIFGSEEIGGAPAISMELLPGGTLKERVTAQGPLPPAEAASAVLDIIGGLDVPTSGQVLYRDTDLTEADEGELTAYRRQHVGFVFQFYNLIPSLTAVENVALVTEISANPMQPEDALRLVKLEARLDQAAAADRHVRRAFTSV